MRKRSAVDQQRLERARIRVSTMLTLASELGSAIGPDEICREPIIAPLSPVAIRSAVVGANLILVVVENLAGTLAGLADDVVLQALLDGLVPPAVLTPDMSPSAGEADGA